MEYKADIGVFGGSGFYSFMDNVTEIDIDTPYGKPSEKVSIANFNGKSIAFLPRHGKKHQYPPHKIPYKANLYAMKQLGVTRIIGPTASGSLQPHIKPGDFVITDQFVDRTRGRDDTYFNGPEVNHISSAYPYCPNLREIAIQAAKLAGITIHEKGTVVVIQGPRFSTVAESRWFNKMGWDVINMTQYPECYLARELGICYLNIALITDYDTGLEGREDIVPVTHDEVLKVMDENNDRVRELLFEIINRIDLSYECSHCQLKQLDS
jgi:5'-methylthioadenosine phosphorylase